MCVMYLNCDFSVKDPYSYEHYLSNSERKKNACIYIIYTRISYIEIVAIHNNYYFTYVLVLSFANRTLPYTKVGVIIFDEIADLPCTTLVILA